LIHKLKTVLIIAVISLISLFTAVFIFTHWPRSMEFTVTVYKYEENADGDKTPNYDNPIGMVCSLRKWYNRFSADIFHGSVYLDGRTFITPENVRWYSFTNRDGVVGLACLTDNPRALWSGSIEYDEDFGNLHIYLDESVYTEDSKPRFKQGEYIRYISHPLSEEIAAFFAP